MCYLGLQSGLFFKKVVYFICIFSNEPHVVVVLYNPTLISGFYQKIIHTAGSVAGNVVMKLCLPSAHAYESERILFCNTLPGK